MVSLEILFPYTPLFICSGLPRSVVVIRLWISQDKRVSCSQRQTEVRVTAREKSFSGPPIQHHTEIPLSRS